MTTKMTVHRNLEQGSDAWLALRMDHFCASEAAAMMGVDPTTSRNELLRLKKTRIAREYSEWVQKNLFDKGHVYEGGYRPIAEEMMGIDLYPTIGSRTVEGLPLLASFDGLSADQISAWEHKTLNGELAERLPNGEIPEWRTWQLEHQLLVSPKTFSITFSASNGVKDGAQNVVYHSNPEKRAELIAGWKQFAIDLEAFVVQEYIPAPVARVVTTLPAVSVMVQGSVSVVHNLPKFQERLLEFVKNDLITDPKSDQDFADLDSQIKAMIAAEKALQESESQMMAQVADLNDARTLKQSLLELTTKHRIASEKLLAAKKLSIRTDIMNESREKYADFIAELNKQFDASYLSIPAGTAPKADFDTAVKNKRTVESLRNSCDTELARVKILANAVAATLVINLKLFNEMVNTDELRALFRDKPVIIHKAADDFALLVMSRIDTHVAAETAKREAIRIEEEAKAAKKLKDEADAQKRKDEEAAAHNKAEEESVAQQPLAETPAVSGVEPQNEESQQTAIVTSTPSVAGVVAEKLTQVGGSVRSLGSGFVSTPAWKLNDRMEKFLAETNWPSTLARDAARAVLTTFDRWNDVTPHG